MKIVLIGATGGIGSRVLDEALRRGHSVTATSRDPAAKLGSRAGMTAKAVNTADVSATAAVLRRHDAAIVSVKWNEVDIHQVLEAIRNSGVKRCLFVIGAGSLLRKDGRTHFEHMAENRNPAADLEAGGARLRGDEESKRARMDGDLACRLDPARRADGQVPARPRSPDRRRRGREPDHPRRLRHRHPRRDRDAPAPAQKVHSRILSLLDTSFRPRRA